MTRAAARKPRVRRNPARKVGPGSVGVFWKCPYCGSLRNVEQAQFDGQYWECIHTCCNREEASRLVYFVRHEPFEKMNKAQCVKCEYRLDCLTAMREVVWTRNRRPKGAIW